MLPLTVVAVYDKGHCPTDVHKFSYERNYVSMVHARSAVTDIDICFVAFPLMKRLFFHVQFEINNREDLEHSSSLLSYWPVRQSRSRARYTACSK